MSNAPVTINIAVDMAEVHRKVDRGTELHRAIETNEKELAEIKAYLREVAKTGAFPVTDTGTVEIRSPESENCVQVCPQKDTPVIIDGKDLSSLKAQLTAGDFGLMFREQITMQRTEQFEKSFNAAAKKVQTIVRRFVAWRPNAHQVRFPK